MIAFFLLHFGSIGVFSFIAFAMAMVILVIDEDGERDPHANRYVVGKMMSLSVVPPQIPNSIKSLE